MPSFNESGLEPPITLGADGRVLYSPILSVDEGHGMHLFEMSGDALSTAEPTQVVLMDREDFDRPVEINDDDRAAAVPIDNAVAGLVSHFEPQVAWEGEGDEAEHAVGGPPDVVDHRPHESSVKFQGGRNTCVAHTSMALLEALPDIPDDLSEQYAHYKFMEFMDVPQRLDRGLLTTDAARFLARGDGFVSEEAAWPYVADHAEIVRLVDAGSYGPPASAVANQTYGYAAYKLIDGGDGTGESIRNPEYLEALLAAGFDIAVGAWVSWNERENTAVMGLVTDPTTGEPYRTAGHAMLIVGYDRPHDYLIVKNSWGPAWGHAGYGYFGYDFARVGFKYGFTVSASVPSI
jgi:hypothetical protein